MVKQPLITNCVTFFRRMLTTVDFNNQAPLPTNEINDEGADRLLTDKLASIQGA
jgi:hypothetical protein